MEKFKVLKCIVVFFMAIGLLHSCDDNENVKFEQPESLKEFSEEVKTRSTWEDCGVEWWNDKEGSLTAPYCYAVYQDIPQNPKSDPSKHYLSIVWNSSFWDFSSEKSYKALQIEIKLVGGYQWNLVGNFPVSYYEERLDIDAHNFPYGKRFNLRFRILHKDWPRPSNVYKWPDTEFDTKKILSLASKWGYHRSEIITYHGYGSPAEMNDPKNYITLSVNVNPPSGYSYHIKVLGNPPAEKTSEKNTYKVFKGFGEWGSAMVEATAYKFGSVSFTATKEVSFHKSMDRIGMTINADDFDSKINNIY